jgi:hypothetical protein
MIVRNHDFEVLSGQTVRYDRKADSGNVIAMNWRALLWLDLERSHDTRHQGGTRGHARQHGLGRAYRKRLDRQQDRPRIGQCP